MRQYSLKSTLISFQSESSLMGMEQLLALSLVTVWKLEHLNSLLTFFLSRITISKPKYFSNCVSFSLHS